MKFDLIPALLLGALLTTPLAAEETLRTLTEKTIQVDPPLPKKAIVVEEDEPATPTAPAAKALTTAEKQPTAQAADATAEKQEVKPTLPKDRDGGVRLQIFLDQKFFGPGIIDGKPGHFTKVAIENYNESLGRPADDLRVVEESVQGVETIYATAIVPSFVDQYVDSTLPTKRLAQATRKYMSYRSVLEFMAERYHCSEELLSELNGYSKMRNAKARMAIKVPNIEPFKIEDLKTGKSHKNEINLTARHVVVDTNTKQVYIYQLILPSDEAGAITIQAAKPKLVASFPITPGETKFIPKGVWNLKNSVELPVWRYDKKLLETGVRGKESLTIPPGPNNPVGIIWNGLTKSGIGIHGTNNPNTIGRARSAGCIRLSNWDAARFPTLVRPGAIVKVE
ncbi:L,D-transpeptidase [Verrucomicrobiaceae bacterium R5-34]|nr:L,D-transpeptidase [Verrucomicrobiaceae bacterium R5-34]